MSSLVPSRLPDTCGNVNPSGDNKDGRIERDACLSILWGLILRHACVVLQSTKALGSSCLIDCLLPTSSLLMVLFFSLTVLTLTLRALSVTPLLVLTPLSDSPGLGCAHDCAFRRL